MIRIIQCGGDNSDDGDGDDEEEDGDDSVHLGLVPIRFYPIVFFQTVMHDWRRCGLPTSTSSNWQHDVRNSRIPGRKQYRENIYAKK